MRDGVAAGGAERCAADDAWALLMLLVRAGVLECWFGCGGGVMRDGVAADRCRRAGVLADPVNAGTGRTHHASAARAGGRATQTLYRCGGMLLRKRESSGAKMRALVRWSWSAGVRVAVAALAGVLQCWSGRACRGQRKNAPGGRYRADYGRQSLGELAAMASAAVLPAKCVRGADGSARRGAWGQKCAPVGGADGSERRELGDALPAGAGETCATSGCLGAKVRVGGAWSDKKREAAERETRAAEICGRG